jgi:endonuclease YncB( thermonuclease family)
MRPARLIVAAAAALLAAAGVRTALTEAAEPAAVERTRAVVTSVVDGDTLRARIRGGRDLGRIRILGIIH